jgi:hypothetical protein
MAKTSKGKVSVIAAQPDIEFRPTGKFLFGRTADTSAQTGQEAQKDRPQEPTRTDTKGKRRRAASRPD